MVADFRCTETTEGPTAFQTEEQVGYQTEDPQVLQVLLCRPHCRSPTWSPWTALPEECDLVASETKDRYLGGTEMAPRRISNQQSYDPGAMKHQHVVIISNQRL